MAARPRDHGLNVFSNPQNPLKVRRWDQNSNEKNTNKQQIRSKVKISQKFPEVKKCCPVLWHLNLLINCRPRGHSVHLEIEIPWQLLLVPWSCNSWQKWLKMQQFTKITKNETIHKNDQKCKTWQNGQKCCPKIFIVLTPESLVSFGWELVW